MYGTVSYFTWYPELAVRIVSRFWVSVPAKFVVICSIFYSLILFNEMKDGIFAIIVPLTLRHKG